MDLSMDIHIHGKPVTNEPRRISAALYRQKPQTVGYTFAAYSICASLSIYVAAKATYIRLLYGKIGILEGFLGPSSVHRGRTHIVLG